VHRGRCRRGRRRGVVVLPHPPLAVLGPEAGVDEIAEGRVVAKLRLAHIQPLPDGRLELGAPPGLDKELGDIAGGLAGLDDAALHEAHAALVDGDAEAACGGEALELRQHRSLGRDACHEARDDVGWLERRVGAVNAVGRPKIRRDSEQIRAGGADTAREKVLGHAKPRCLCR